jgi:hypothetical protein
MQLGEEAAAWAAAGGGANTGGGVVSAISLETVGEALEVRQSRSDMWEHWEACSGILVDRCGGAEIRGCRRQCLADMMLVASICVCHIIASCHVRLHHVQFHLPSINTLLGTYSMLHVWVACS